MFNPKPEGLQPPPPPPPRAEVVVHIEIAR